MKIAESLQGAVDRFMDGVRLTEDEIKNQRDARWTKLWLNIGLKSGNRCRGLMNKLEELKETSPSIIDRFRRGLTHALDGTP